MKQYDYIIVGAGCAGLSLLMRILDTPGLNRCRILLVEKSPKESNDRTWCFWEEHPGYFEHLVHSTWHHLWIHCDSYSKQLDMGPYRYKMIRSIDFYSYCFNRIAQFPGVEIIYGELRSVSVSGRSVSLRFNAADMECEADYVFNSLYRPPEISKEKYLLQHFKGWVIKTESGQFDPSRAVLMDFRVEQHKGMSFVYLLPFAHDKALVEYTLFSERQLPAGEYQEGLLRYLREFLEIKNFSILETESGVIPMTNYKFPFHHHGMFHIGTAGGQTKASTGYTFQFIQKRSEAIVKALSRRSNLATMQHGNCGRFHFYDSILLRILANRSMEGKDIFAQLFRENRASDVFRFLDNESSVAQELKIINTLPKAVFTKAAIRQILSLA